MQADTGGAIPSGQSEDCLFINVWAPSGATSSSNLPVWFYVEGGGFNDDADSGRGGENVINDSGGNLVFVTLSYRVGIFGGLCSAEVLANGDANQMLWDVRAALGWIQEHIAQVRARIPSSNGLSC